MYVQSTCSNSNSNLDLAEPVQSPKIVHDLVMLVDWFWQAKRKKGEQEDLGEAILGDRDIVPDLDGYTSPFAEAIRANKDRVVWPFKLKVFE